MTNIILNGCNGKMGGVITELVSHDDECKIVAGGAVMTEEYAEMIGADCYSPDAMATVRYAKKVYN